MDITPHEKIEVLQNENKTLKGKLRGYQTLGQLFQEVKERNRVLELELQKKETISVATEMETKPEKTGPGDVISVNPNHLPKDNCTSLSEKNKTITSEDDGDTNSVKNSSLESSSDKIHMSNAFSLPTENPEISESNLLLTKKLEDALRLVDEYGRKRSNDKKLVKILNEEVKKAKDELHSVMDKLGNAEQENKLMMKKIARLEQERDSIPLNIAAINTEVSEAEATEDWVHLHQETPPVDDKMYELQKKCEELKHKATRWENEHFNLQIEYTKHVNDLRGLLECKSKELIKVTENLTSDKKILESKFKKLETMLKEEKDAKFEAYTMHQETMRKYKILEKKFLALEQNNMHSASETLEPKTKMSQASDYEEQITMLRQQVALFKEDFDKERKERLIAQKQSQKFEEMLQNKSKQLEKKEIDLSKCENSLKEELTKNQKMMAKIKTLESNHEKVLHHNHMLMELQSKMSAGQISKPKYGYPNPIPAASNENLLTFMEWPCKQCTFTNSYQNEVCLICKAPKSPTRQATSKLIGRWKCSCCTYVNNYKADECAMCRSSRNSCQWEENEHLSKLQNEPSISSHDNDLAIDGPTTD